MSWEQLLSIIHEGHRDGPRTACPECGTPLDTGPAGERFCPFDGWRA